MNQKDGIYLELPAESGQAVLHPAKLLESETDRLMATPVSDDLAFEVQQRLAVYYYNRREFTKRMAVVDSVGVSDGTTQVGFSFLGEACPADRRTEYRVSAVVEEICVGLDDEPSCELADISPTGCSVRAVGPYQIGQNLKISLEHEGKTITGKVIVRGIQTGRYEKTRYGLCVVSDRGSGDSLKKMLRKMTIALERTQLRRLAGC